MSATSQTAQQTTGLIGLAEAIGEHTGMTGAELEAFTFFVAAGFADLMGRKDIGDHFEARCKEASKRAGLKATL